MAYANVRDVKFVAVERGTAVTEISCARFEQEFREGRAL